MTKMDAHYRLKTVTPDEDERINFRLVLEFEMPLVSKLEPGAWVEELKAQMAEMTDGLAERVLADMVKAWERYEKGDFEREGDGVVIRFEEVNEHEPPERVIEA